MTENARSGRLLFTAIAGTLLVAAVLLVWAGSRQEKRRLELSEHAIGWTRQLLDLRLDGFFHEVAEDLREEAAAVEAGDSLVVFQRWFALLDTHWPITSIRLADENGNETALEREDTTYLLTRTYLGSKDGPPISMRYRNRVPTSVVQGPWIEADKDPRERVWFSKALEDTDAEPNWTLSTSDDGRPELQVSHLIRNRTADEPYRIIFFSLDPGRSAWLDTYSATLLQAGILLMNDEGEPLIRATPNDDRDMSAALDQALASWMATKTRSSFHVGGGLHSYRVSMAPYLLHGQALNTAVLVDPSDMDRWLEPERITLYIIAALLVLLIVLLMLAWYRKRRSDERVRQQARRSRSQELKLAKALGEREVLNREVHHRVKNNLQVVSSLLNLQATRLDDGPVKNEFLRGKRRIDTIALVHHKLYGLSDLRNVDLSLFFNDLVRSLADMHLPQSRSVSHEIITNMVRADQDTAIELGIILCELVANTYQHAFPYATGGHIEIKLQPVQGDLYRLAVKDNGKGIGAGEHQGAGKLGLEIVEALTEQLNGSFQMHVQNGVLFEVLFRMQHETADTGQEQAEGPDA